MEIPISGVILVSWSLLLAAFVCGGGIFAASERRHTSPGECNHALSAGQVYHSPLYQKPNKRLRHALARQEQRTILDNIITPH